MVTRTSFVEFTGAAKLDRRTKNLVRRLGPEDVAVIDHTDLDRVSAEELLESGVRVVVNVGSSQSGRFPMPSGRRAVVKPTGSSSPTSMNICTILRCVSTCKPAPKQVSLRYRHSASR